MNLVLEKSALALRRITVKYLHFALVSIEPEFLDVFQNKPFLNDSVVTL